MSHHTHKYIFKLVAYLEWHIKNVWIVLLLITYLNNWTTFYMHNYKYCWTDMIWYDVVAKISFNWKLYCWGPFENLRLDVFLSITYKYFRFCWCLNFYKNLILYNFMWNITLFKYLALVRLPDTNIKIFQVSLMDYCIH